MSRRITLPYLSLGLRMALRRSRAPASMWMRHLAVLTLQGPQKRVSGSVEQISEGWG